MKCYIQLLSSVIIMVAASCGGQEIEASIRGMDEPPPPPPFEMGEEVKRLDPLEGVWVSMKPEEMKEVKTCPDGGTPMVKSPTRQQAHRSMDEWAIEDGATVVGVYVREVSGAADPYTQEVVIASIGVYWHNFNGSVGGFAAPIYNKRGGNNNPTVMVWVPQTQFTPVPYHVEAVPYSPFSLTYDVGFRECAGGSPYLRYLGGY